ncbi:fused DSP-PTPase phosphatase/NAD kinase-like protein [Hydrogenovibrio halophilus]|uniref:fused DSP-PTPase phosphatase/NAD kinase-like protein n=1 Tax=Hydrogenovibrio halophilus TaxID=373391 RepID=UPI0003754954|nr:tyrosine-protein phosphatase [Hydrogenovibrio halophilus]
MSKLHSKRGRLLAHLEAWLIDHEILRIWFRNFYRLAPRHSDTLAFRSNHPSPRFLRKLKQRFGLKTVLSLRAANQTGQYLLEKEACDQLGIELINVPISSRNFPKKDKLEQVITLLQSLDYPLLIHCKSGADRAGLVSVLFKHFVQGEPIAEARKQLSMKYGHFRWADTGKLDYLFDEFERFQTDHPEVSFHQWVQQHYDRDQLNQTFHASGWANIVVNKILHRE